jgi:hypothetical protein
MGQSQDPPGSTPSAAVAVLRRQRPVKPRYDEIIAQYKVRQGWFGSLFGDVDHSANNIVGISLMTMLALVLIMVTMVFVLNLRKSTADDLKAVILTTLALIGTTIGYLFGRRDREK